MKATRAAAEDQASAAKLARTLNAAAGATAGQVKATEEWITAQGKAKGFADDELRPALSKLVVATGSVAKAQKAAALAMDISTGTGKSLESVSFALAKAQSGNVAGLARLGVKTTETAKDTGALEKALTGVKSAQLSYAGALKTYGKDSTQAQIAADKLKQAHEAVAASQDKTTKTTLSLDEITKNLADTYGGAASKNAETAAGKQKILEVQMHELQEQIGLKLLPVMSELVDAGTKVVDWISKNTKAAGILLAALGALLGAIAGVSAATKAWEAIQVLTTKTTQLWATQVGETATTMNRLRFGGAIAGVAALTASTQTSNDKLKGLLQIGGGVATGFAVGGPIGAAVGGAAGLFAVLAQHMNDAGDAARTSKADYSGLGDTLDSLTGAVTENTRKFVENQLARSGTLKTLATYGITTRQAISATLGESSARKVVSAAIQRQVDDYKSLNQQIKDLHTAPPSADEKNSLTGGLTPEAFAARKKLADQLQEQADAEKKVIDAVRDGIGVTKAAVVQKRADIAATSDYSGELKGLPTAAVTDIKANGIVPTRKSIALLSKEYDLTPKQIKTVISAAGVDTTVKQVKTVEKGLTDVSKVRPDLSGFKASLGTQIDQAGGIARSGGTAVGNALGSGIKSGLAGTLASIGQTAADVVRAAIREARRAADAHSPSRETEKLGKDMGDGLTKGINDSRAKVVKATRDTVKAALDAARSDMKQLAATVRDAFRSDLFPEATDIWGTTGSPIGTLKTDIANAKAFRSALGKLKGEGLSGAAFASVASSGNLQAANALAANKRSVREFEHLFRQRSKLTGDIGQFAGRTVDGKQIDRMVELLDSIDHRLANMPKDTGKETSKAVNGAVTHGQHRRPKHR